MNVKITYGGNDRGAQALIFGELAIALSDHGLTSDVDTSAPKVGEKGDVPTALLVAGLAVQTLGTLVSVLTFLYNGRPSYTVTLKRGEATYTIGNLTSKQVLAISAELAAADPLQDIQVEIV